MNKILIIDDDRELCALIKRSLQAENIEADFCNTGKEGLQKLREQEYQLVVLDVMMPGDVYKRQGFALYGRTAGHTRRVRAHHYRTFRRDLQGPCRQIGRASCRERV